MVMRSLLLWRAKNKGRGNLIIKYDDIFLTTISGGTKPKMSISINFGCITIHPKLSGLKNKHFFFPMILWICPLVLIQALASGLGGLQWPQPHV